MARICWQPDWHGGRVAARGAGAAGCEGIPDCDRAYGASRHSDERRRIGLTGFQGLFGELRRLDYIEGQNLIVERYSGENNFAHYELAREVVRQQPDLIFANGRAIRLGLKEATSTIPIVGYMSDPVENGLVASLSRPGGNMTGVSDTEGEEIIGKRLGLLRE